MSKGETGPASDILLRQRNRRERLRGEEPDRGEEEGGPKSLLLLSRLVVAPSSTPRLTQGGDDERRIMVWDEESILFAL